MLPRPTVKDLEPKYPPIHLNIPWATHYREGLLLAKTLNKNTIGVVIPVFRPDSWDKLDGMEFKVPLWEKNDKRYISLPDYIYEFYKLLSRRVTFTWVSAIFLIHIGTVV